MEVFRLDFEKAIEAYISGGARLLTRVYALEATKKGITAPLPNKAVAEKYSMNSEIARKLVMSTLGEAFSLSQELDLSIHRDLLATIGVNKLQNIDDGLNLNTLDDKLKLKMYREYYFYMSLLPRSSTRLMPAERLLATFNRETQEGQNKYYLSLYHRESLPLRDAVERAAAEADIYSLEPVILFMTTDILHTVILIQLVLIKWLARGLRGEGVEPRVVMLLWKGMPGDSPEEKGNGEEDGHVSLERIAPQIISDDFRVEVIEVTPATFRELEPGPEYWELYEFVAAAHSLYYTRGVTAPHNLLINSVIEETGTYLAVQNRGFTLLYTLIRKLGFPFRCDICGGRKPLYIYVGGLTYHATMRLLLDALLLAHPTITRSLGMKYIASKYSKVSEAFQWPIDEEDYDFTTYVLEVRRIMYPWVATAMLKKVTYQVFSDARKKRELRRAAAEVYEALASQRLEAAISELVQITFNTPLIRVNGKIYISPRALEPLIATLRALEPALEKLRELAEKHWKDIEVDIITCRNIIEGLNYPLDMAFLYQALNADLLGLPIEEGVNGLPKEITLPSLGLKREAGKISFRRCKEALQKIILYTDLIRATALFLEKLKEDSVAPKGAIK